MSTRTRRKARRTAWTQVALAVVITAGALWMWEARGAQTATVVTSRHSPIAFAATVQNRDAAPTQTPDGMVWIPGGEFSMGAQDPPEHDEVGMLATRDARPIHRVYVDGFWMDRTVVTNAEFAQFVKATRYVTVAERTPRAADSQDSRTSGAASSGPAAGSFLCTDQSVPATSSAREGKGEVSSGANHLGFRCVKDVR